VKEINMSMHKAWGDSVWWFDYEKGIVTGHLTPKPQAGDKIICEMYSPNPDTSRHFKILIVKKIEDFSDPPDQFFADVEDLGYIIRAGEKEVRFELGSKCPFCRKRFKKDFQHMANHMNDKHPKEVSI